MWWFDCFDFVYVGVDNCDEVGWYILGENQQNLGPYAFSELRGKWMCLCGQLRILLMALAYWYIHLVVLFFGSPPICGFCFLNFSYTGEKLHDELVYLDLFTWRGQSISWMGTSLKIPYCGLREEVIGSHYLQFPSWLQQYLNQELIVPVQVKIFAHKLVNSLYLDIEYFKVLLAI